MKHSPPRLMQWSVWSGLLLIAGTIAVLFLLKQRTPRLPNLPVFYTAGDFALTNQAGRRVTQADLRGRIWIADVIFTRCPGTCLQMTGKMKELQQAVPSEAPVRFISVTTDPDYDTPQVLQRYAENAGADPARWWFLTGTKDLVRQWLAAGLKLIAEERPEAERESAADLYVHSTFFLVFDRAGRSRAIIESLEPDSRQRVLAAVQQLLRED